MVGVGNTLFYMVNISSHKKYEYKFNVWFQKTVSLVHINITVYHFEDNEWFQEIILYMKFYPRGFVFFPLKLKRLR